MWIIILVVFIAVFTLYIFALMKAAEAVIKDIEDYWNNQRWRQ